MATFLSRNNPDAPIRMVAADSTEPSFESKVLGWATRIAITLLMLSAIRAPESMPFLNPLVVLFKAGIRFSVLTGVSFALLIAWREIIKQQTLVWFLPFFAFCGWGIFSTLWSPLKSESLGQAMSLTTLVIVGLAVSVVIRDEDGFERMMRWVMWNLLLILSFILLTGKLIPATGHMTRDGMGLGHATNTGATSSVSIVVLVLFFLFWDWKWTRWMLLPGLLVFSAVSVFSSNRMSMAIAAAIIPVSVLFFGRRYLVGLMFVTIAMVGFAYPIVDPQFDLFGSASESFNRGQSSDEIGSLSGRADMWAAIWKSYLESPIIGHGFFVSSKTGGFEVWYMHGEMTTVNWTAHNVWLQALVSTGIIGLGLFMIAVLFPLLWAFSKPLKGFKMTNIDKFTVILAVWYFIWSLMNESILGPVQPECVIFFVAFGGLISNHARQLSAASLTISTSESTRSTNIDRLPAGGVCPS